MEKTTSFKTGKLKRGLEGMEPWEQIIERNLRSSQRTGRPKIYASNSSLCPRQTAAFTKIEDHVTKRKASSEFYFATGNLFEDLMGKAFEKEGILILREFRVESNHSEVEVAGRIDFILKDLETGDPLLMELKSTGKLPTSPKPAHLAQLQTYMLLTGQSRALLWYVSRYVSDFSGNLKQKVFEITMNEDEKRDAALRLALGAVYIDSPFLPPKPDYMKKWKCSFCPLVPFCWQDGDPEDINLSFEEPDDEDQEMLLKQAEMIADEIVTSQADLKRIFEKELSFIVTVKE